MKTCARRSQHDGTLFTKKKRLKISQVNVAFFRSVVLDPQKRLIETVTRCGVGSSSHTSNLSQMNEGLSRKERTAVCSSPPPPPMQRGSSTASHTLKHSRRASPGLNNDGFYDSPPPQHQRISLTNVSRLLNTQERCNENHTFTYFLVRKSLSTDDAGVARDTVFHAIRPCAGFKTGDFVE